jgi:hypothetical protein
MEFHVAPDGSDASAGSAEFPWQTLSWGASQLMPGDTLIVHAGNYAERLLPPRSGTRGAYITFRARRGDVVTIDGTGLPVSGLSGLVDLSNRSFLRLEGFGLRNYTSAVRGAVPVGILLQGSSEGVEIVDNRISGIASTATVDANRLGRDAHGIALYGNAAEPIRDLLIRGNELTDLTLGSSEALVLNGNVEGFRVVDNHVHHCDNIGIDAIGFEGVGPTDALDQARHGWIVGNRVHDLSSVGNPAYGTEASAGGLYVDGGRDLVLSRNEVSRCDIGIEVASEHTGRVSTGIVVRSNLLRENLMGGLFMGGYNATSTGDVADCLVAHNTFVNNDTLATGDEYGQIHLQYRVQRTAFVGNILVQENTKAGGHATFIVHWNTTGGALTFDRNLFFGAGTPVWVLDDTWIEGWSNYVASSWSGTHEGWSDPLFVDAAKGDFSLLPGSPAIDAGEALILVPGERDLNGHLRAAGVTPDRGALEFGASPPPVASLLATIMTTGVRIGWRPADGGFWSLEDSLDLKEWSRVPGFDTRSFDVVPESYDTAGEPDRARFFRFFME